MVAESVICLKFCSDAGWNFELAAICMYMVACVAASLVLVRCMFTVHLGVVFVGFCADEHYAWWSGMVRLGLCVFRCVFDFAQWRYRSQ